MSLWTIKYNGTEKGLAAWGVKNVVRSLVSQGMDTLTFTQPAASATEDPSFAEGQILELFRDGVRWFYGRVEDAAAIGDARYAGLRYTVSGPWWWLEHMGFRQVFKSRTALGQALIDQYTSYCLLGSKVDGTQQSIAAQIAEAVDYAITQGAPLAFDSVGLPSINPPLRDAWNAPVAEVIRKMIEWAPDIVTWFDYSTTPYPTLKMRRRETQIADLGVSIGFEDDNIQNLEIKARNDLKVPGVIVYYIRTDTENGQIYTIISEDKYPAETEGTEPKALLAAVNLEGTQVTYLQGPITCEPIAANSADWWKRRKPDLALPSITALTIEGATFVDLDGSTIAAPLPNEMVGMYANWMGGNVQEMVVQAYATYEETILKEDGTPAKDPVTNLPIKNVIKRRPITVNIVATDKATGTYNSAPGGSYGEGLPSGLAEVLYKAASVTHYEGRLVIKEDQCSAVVSLGNVLNVTEGRAAWASMNAQIQTVSEEIDSGRTTIVFGPPKHLGPSDYIELLRATRNRIRYATPSMRSTGVGAGGSAILGKTLSKQVAGSGYGGVVSRTFIDPTDPNGAASGRITFTLSEFPGVEIKPRLLKYCDNGVEKQIWVWASAPF